jgi:hypothetical protein
LATLVLESYQSGAGTEAAAKSSGTSFDAVQSSKTVNPEPPIRHAHDDDLQLYVLGRLSAEEVAVLERHLADCAECADKLSTTARLVAKLLTLTRHDTGPGRRTEPRFELSDDVYLRCFAPMLPDRWRVQILNISSSGLGLLVPARLTRGVVVQIQSGPTFALGEVVYCRQINEREFQIGVRLQDMVGPAQRRENP